MLRIYCLQQWYNLSDPGAEEAANDQKEDLRKSPAAPPVSEPPYVAE
jgi:hypothetical protein